MADFLSLDEGWGCGLDKIKKCGIIWEGKKGKKKKN
jgi:hypothetical protein